MPQDQSAVSNVFECICKTYLQNDRLQSRATFQKAIGVLQAGIIESSTTNK